MLVVCLDFFEVLLNKNTNKKTRPQALQPRKSQHSVLYLIGMKVVTYSSILLLLIAIVYTVFTCGTLGVDNSTDCSQSPSNVTIALEEFVTNLTSPIFIDFATVPGSFKPSMFVGQRDGIIYQIEDMDTPDNRTVFLNLTSELLPDLNLTVYDERGLLAIAFHSDFSRNGKFYVWYTASSTNDSMPEVSLDDQNDLFEDDDSSSHNNTDLICNSNVTDHFNKLEEYQAQLVNGTLIVSKVRTLLVERHPFFNNNGVQNLEFNALDGLLYLGIGDGGLVNDPSQDDDSIRGKILRMNVDRLLATDNCSTPVSTISELLSSCPGVATHTQVVSKGIRNLSGMSIISDKQIPAGAIVSEPESDMLQAVTQFGLMVTQVGQNEYQGIYLVRTLGSNLGWSYLDMSHCMDLSDGNVCNISLPFNDGSESDSGIEPSLQVTLPVTELLTGTSDSDLNDTNPLHMHSAIIGGRFFTGLDVNCLLTNKYIFASTNGSLFFIDPVQLLQVSFNTSDNSTGLPFPNHANLTNICFANGTSPDEGGLFLDDYRDTFLPIHSIQIANLAELLGGFNSTSTIHITCVQVSPDGSTLFVCAHGPDGGSVLRMTFAGNATVDDSFGDDLEYYEFD